MENISFDFGKILKMRMDRIILDIATSETADLTRDQKNTATVRDLLMVFINHGVELPIAIDILKDVTDILVKSQGGEKDGYQE